MDVRTTFNSILYSGDEVYEILSRLTLEVVDWSIQQGFSPRTASRELEAYLKDNRNEDPRKYFWIFNDEIISVQPESSKIRLSRFSRSFKENKGKFPPKNIAEKIAVIQITRNIFTEMGNYAAHTIEIDNGPLLILASTVLRLREVVSDALYEKHEGLWNKAASIFSSKFNFSYAYDVDAESSDTEPKTTDSATKTVQQTSNVKQPEQKQGTLRLKESQQILAKIAQLTDRFSAYESTQRTLADIEKANNVSLDNRIGKLDQRIAEIYKNLTEMIVEIYKNLTEMKEVFQNTSSENVEHIVRLDDKFSELLNQVTVDDEQDESIVEPATGTHDDFIEEQPSINKRQASDKLLQLRNRIRDQFPDLENWENILQKPIVDVMIADKPSTREEWKSIPTVSQKYRNHQDVMDPQLANHWEEIRSILLQIESPD